MRQSIAVAVLAGLFGAVAALAGAPDTQDAVAFVQKFSQAANGTDREAYAAFCDPDIIIIDHVPPYVFRGPKACQEEWDAVAAWIERNRITPADYGTLSAPSFVDRDGDRVYAVFPATAGLMQDGRAEVEKGWWTFVLRRDGASWRILGMSWATESLGGTPLAR